MWLETLLGALTLIDPLDVLNGSGGDVHDAGSTSISVSTVMASHRRWKRPVWIEAVYLTCTSCEAPFSGDPFSFKETFP